MKKINCNIFLSIFLKQKIISTFGGIGGLLGGRSSLFVWSLLLFLEIILLSTPLRASRYLSSAPISLSSMYPPYVSTNFDLSGDSGCKYLLSFCVSLQGFVLFTISLELLFPPRPLLSLLIGSILV